MKAVYLNPAFQALFFTRFDRRDDSALSSRPVEISQPPRADLETISARGQQIDHGFLRQVRGDDEVKWRFIGDGTAREQAKTRLRFHPLPIPPVVHRSAQLNDRTFPFGGRTITEDFGDGPFPRAMMRAAFDNDRLGGLSERQT